MNLSQEPVLIYWLYFIMRTHTREARARARKRLNIDLVKPDSRRRSHSHARKRSLWDLPVWPVTCNFIEGTQ